MTLELDPKNFDEMVKAYGTDATRDLLKTFLDDAQHQVTAIVAALTAGDAHGLRHAAHQLKSASAMLGATALAALCGQLESQGRAGPASFTTELGQQLQQRFQRVQAEMGARLSTSTQGQRT